MLLHGFCPYLEVKAIKMIGNSGNSMTCESAFEIRQMHNLYLMEEMEKWARSGIVHSYRLIFI